MDVVTRSLRRVSMGLTVSLRVAAALVVVAMMLSIGYDVFARYVLTRPTDWALPLNALAVLAVTFLAVPDLFTRDEHITVDLAVRALPRTGQRMADIVVRVVTLVFGLVLAWLGFDYAWVTYTSGLTTSGLFTMPQWVVVMPIAMAGVLLAVAAVLPRVASAETPERDLAEATAARSESGNS